MDSTLKKISSDLEIAENNFNHCISTLKEYASKWSAIKTSFSIYSNDLSSFSNFVDLQNRLELSQLSACDSIIAEMSRQLVLFDQTLTNLHATFVKTKKQFESKPKEEAWDFPPNTTFLPNLIIETSRILDEAFNKAESRKLAIYKLVNEEEAIDPDSIERFINSIS